MSRTNAAYCSRHFEGVREERAVSGYARLSSPRLPRAAALPSIASPARPEVKTRRDGDVRAPASACLLVCGLLAACSGLARLVALFFP